MDKQRAAELDQMLKQWARAQAEGAFDALGWHSGGDDSMPKAVGRSKSNAAQTAELTKLRELGYADAMLIHGAIALALGENRRAILAVKYRYLMPGTWYQQAHTLSQVVGGMTKEAYRQYVKAGIHAIDAELQNIGRSTEPAPTYPLEKLCSS